MDALDHRLLSLLQEDGRLSITDLAKAVNLSRPRVAERLKRLQDSGAILGFSAVVSEKALGYPILALIQIGELCEPCAAFEEAVRKLPAVLECHRVTGAVSYILKAALPDMHGLEALVDQLIAHGRVNTAVVLSSPIPRRPLLHPSQEAAAGQ